MRGKYATHPTPLSAYVAAAPHSTAFFFLFLLLLLCLTTAVLPVGQEVSSASCHSPLSCGHFLVFCPSTHRAAMMFSPRGELRQAGRQAGLTPVIGGLALQPSPTLWRLLAFTTCATVSGLKVKISLLHFQAAPSFQNSPIVQTVATVSFFFVTGFGGKKQKTVLFSDETVLLS